MTFLLPPPLENNWLWPTDVICCVFLLSVISSELGQSHVTLLFVKWTTSRKSQLRLFYHFILQLEVSGGVICIVSEAGFITFSVFGSSQFSSHYEWRGSGMLNDTQCTGLSQLMSVCPTTNEKCCKQRQTSYDKAETAIESSQGGCCVCQWLWCWSCSFAREELLLYTF